MELYGYKDVLRDLLLTAPSTIEGQSNFTTQYYKERLLNRILGAFEITGEIPETWDKNFFLPVLFLQGYFGVTPSPYGLLALNCGLEGRNFNYQPVRMIFTNPDPNLGSWTRTIGKDGALIRLSPSMVGFDGMVRRYAEMLASVDCSINVNIINSRASYFAQAETKAEAQGLKKVIDQISRGVNAVFWRKKTGLDTDTIPFQHIPVRDSFIAGELLDARRIILEDFDREIGFSMIQKKERLIQSENEANNAEIYNNIQLIVDTVEESFEECNRLFGTDLHFKYRYEGIMNPEQDEGEPEEVDAE